MLCQERTLTFAVVFALALDALIDQAQLLVVTGAPFVALDALTLDLHDQADFVP